MGDTGLELPAYSRGKTGVSHAGGNKSGNTAAGELDAPAVPPVPDAELLAVIKTWSTLPVAVRRGIVAMVQASGGVPIDREAGE